MAEDVSTQPNQPSDEPPEWLTNAVNESVRKGVFIEMDESLDNVTRIGWRPGEQNPLADVIIKYARYHVELDLNGHLFSIQPLSPASHVPAGPLERVFTRDILEEWGVPYEIEALHREHADTLRWHMIYNLVFRAPDDDLTYQVTYFRGNTEYQDQDVWDGADRITGVRVEPRSEVITTWQELRRIIPGNL